MGWRTKKCHTQFLSSSTLRSAPLPIAFQIIHHEYSLHIVIEPNKQAPLKNDDEGIISRKDSSCCTHEKQEASPEKEGAENEESARFASTLQDGLYLLLYRKTQGVPSEDGKAGNTGEDTRHSKTGEQGLEESLRGRSGSVERYGCKGQGSIRDGEICLYRTVESH